MGWDDSFPATNDDVYGAAANVCEKLDQILVLLEKLLDEKKRSKDEAV
jgi:hypothetical protein